jgi:divalent metal cation (Fe/Co/Zn/Cd) transporter
MSAFVVTLMFTAGAAVWIYTKFQKYSGNNTRQSAIAAGVAALFIFITFYLLTRSILK